MKEDAISFTIAGISGTIGWFCPYWGLSTMFWTMAILIFSLTIYYKMKKAETIITLELPADKRNEFIRRYRENDPVIMKMCREFKITNIEECNEESN